MDLKITFWKKPYGWQTFQEALVGGIIYFLKAFKDLLLYGRKVVDMDTDLENKIWLMISTKNNLDTLTFLQNNLENSIVIATNKQVQRLGRCPRLSFHLSAMYWFKSFYLLFTLWPYLGKAMLWRFDIFFQGLGLYEISRKILQRHRPKALIFANDHSPEQRALFWAAKDMDIPTVYIQHASVTYEFPPLRYSLSLLEGQDSLEKYEACGPVEGRVELIGMPKFDPYYSQKNINKGIQHIGVCGNIWDDAGRIEDVLVKLSDRFPDITLNFRPHPGEERSFKLPEEVNFSDSKKEKIFDFLVQQDLIIAGDSSLHLEAALLNINSLYFPMNDIVSDVYGYVQNGLIERMYSTEDLLHWIEKYQYDRPSISSKVTYYNAVAGTSLEGRSQELALRFIRELLAK